jgi:hypothetical protein
MKQAILNIQVGSLIWNVCGLAEIVEITAKGISTVDNAAYCCFKTKFGSNGSTMSGSIRENRAEYKDGYLLDSSIAQFIPNHKASDFITTSY